MPPAGRSPKTRAAPRPAPPPAPAAQRRLLPIALTAVWWLVLAVLLLQKGRALEEKTTWYLAVDQFGYATLTSSAMASAVPGRDVSLRRSCASMLCVGRSGFPVAAQ